MIRGKKLRALAVIGDKPVELDGYGVIEPLTKSVPGFKSPANYFGIFIPKGVPPEVIATVEKIWADQIVNSATLEAVRDEPRRAVRAVCRRRGAEGGDALRCRPTRGPPPTPARRRSRPTRCGIPRP